MAITFQYGPPADILGLARKTGEGIRRTNQAAADNDYLSLVNAAQQEQNRKRASEIQFALSDASLAQQADQNAQANDQREREFAAEMADRNASRDIARQNAETAARNADTAEAYRTQQASLANQKFTSQQQGISNLPPDQQAAVQATGRLPYVANGAQDNSAAQLRAEYTRLRTDLATAEKKLKDASYDENDFDKVVSSEPSKTVPGAIAGLEAHYQDAARTRQAIQQRLAQLDQALQGRTTSLLAPGSQPAVSPQAAQQIIQARQQPQAMPPQAQNAPVVNTMQEYAALPSGAFYIDAQDGQVYQKK